MTKDPVYTGERDGKPVFRVQQGYDAYSKLSTGPNQALMIPPLLSGREEVERGRDKALRAAQDVDRNNDLIRGALDRKANTVVGAALYPIPQPDLRWLKQDVAWSLEYREAAVSVFKEWGRDERCLCDAEGHYQFGGLMWQAFRALAGPDAEVAGYIGLDRERADSYNHKWATYVHIVDSSRVETPPAFTSDKRVQNGRRLDPLGRMVGFYVSNAHQSDRDGMNEHEYIPRETDYGRPMGFHWFFKRRAGMQRAITSLATSLRGINMLDKFNDALLQSAAANALIATYIKTEMSPEKVSQHLAPASDEDELSGFNMKVAAYEKMGLKAGNMRIPVLAPNDEIVMESAKASVIDADAFRNAFLRNFASALGVSFEQLSLDYSQGNYSSMRASLIEARRTIIFERGLFTSHVATLIYSAVIEEAFALGILKPPPGAPSFYEARAAYTAVRWIGPGMGWVDPLKEAKGAQARWELGAETLDSIAAEHGSDAFDNLQNKAVEVKMMRDLDLPVPGENKPPEQGGDSGSDIGDAGDEGEDSKSKRKKRDGDGDGTINEDQEGQQE